MVCIYCSGKTKVVNSRLQKKANNIWRRRKCLDCGNVFTSIESFKDIGSLVTQTSNNKLIPFIRENLFISIYESCRHRKSAILDAKHLTSTIIDKIALNNQNGIIGTDKIKETVLSTLKSFDAASASHYKAYFIDD